MIENDMNELRALQEKQENSNQVQFSKVERNSYAEGCKTCSGRCMNVLCVCSTSKTIDQGQIGLLMRFGKFVKKLPPGLYLINPCTENVIIQSTKTQVIK